MALFCWRQHLITSYFSYIAGNNFSALWRHYDVIIDLILEKMFQIEIFYCIFSINVVNQGILAKKRKIAMKIIIFENWPYLENDDVISPKTPTPNGPSRCVGLNWKFWGVKTAVKILNDF